MTGQDDEGGRKSFVPSIAPGADPSRFRLDQTTKRLLDLVDGARDDESLAGALGTDPGAIRATLDMLERAGLVSIAEVDAPADEELEPLPDDDAAHEAVTKPPPGPLDVDWNADEAITKPPPAPAAAGRIPEEAATRPPPGPPEGAAPGGDPWEGAASVSLANKPAKALLEELEKSRFGGAVRFQRGADAVELFFEGGQPLGVRSGCARHDLGAMLHQAGKIGAQRFDGYRAVMREGDVNPVVALRRAGVADRAELARLLAWHGAAILAELSGWRDGAAMIGAGVPFPQGVAKVRIKADSRGVKADWRDGPLDPEEDAFIERNAARYLVVNPAAGKVLAEMRLGEKEARYIRHVAGSPKQLREALSISTLYRSLTRKLLYALIDAGLFGLQDTNPEGDSEIPLEELESYAGSLERENHFNVLAAHPSSTEREIAERFAVRMAQFQNSRFSNAEPEHLEWLGKIRARLQRAFDCLKDEKSRREYREKMYEKEQIDNFFELQLRKAEVVLKMRCDPKGALEIAESALELKPGEPEASILAATALARLGKAGEAARLIGAVRAIPGRLKADMDELSRLLGRPVR